MFRAFLSLERFIKTICVEITARLTSAVKSKADIMPPMFNKLQISLPALVHSTCYDI